jgi:hypothetical protein
MATTLPKLVSEKTLELNLSAELLQRTRRRAPFGQAYLIGMTQAQEHLNGVDAAVMSMGVMLGAIQFKAPLHPGPDAHYWFALEGTQLANLQSLEARFPGRVAYYLPRINTPNDLRSHSPAFLAQTNSLAVAGIAPGSHKARAEPGRVFLRSEPVEVESPAADEQFERWLGDAEARAQEGRGESGDDGEILLGWLSEVAEMPNRVAGQALRGLAVLGIPRQTGR